MKSTPEEIDKARKLVRKTEEEIEQLVQEGKQVHIIWDFDGVLSSSLSDDVFEICGRNLEKYFEYEARMFLSPPRSGLWLELAKKVGKLHQTQDIVTTRSSFLAFRVMTFCMWHCGSDISRFVRWMLYIGHQSKSDSFRIILESLKENPNIFVYFIDDSSRHVETFIEASQGLGMAERTIGIVSPKIRDYDEEQLKWHYEEVMKSQGDNPVITPGTPGGYVNGHIVFPNGLGGFRELVAQNYFASERTSAIEKFGPILEMTCKED